VPLLESKSHPIYSISGNSIREPMPTLIFFLALSPTQRLGNCFDAARLFSPKVTYHICHFLDKETLVPPFHISTKLRSISAFGWSNGILNVGSGFRRRAFFSRDVRMFQRWKNQVHGSSEGRKKGQNVSVF